MQAAKVVVHQGRSNQSERKAFVMAEVNSTQKDNEAVEYREVPGFPGYRVGSDGSVWSSIRNNGHAVITVGNQWKKLKYLIGRTRHYAHVTLCRNGEHYPKMVHRLILITFSGEPKPGQEVRHLDGNMHNNSLSNLAWGTRKENMADCFAHGTACIGERNGTSVLSIEEVRKIRDFKKSGMPLCQVVRELGRNYWTVRNVYDGTRWQKVM